MFKLYFTAAIFFASHAMALEMQYDLHIENQQGRKMVIGKKNAALCEHDLERVAMTYANLKSAQCLPRQDVTKLQSEMREKVRQYSCNIPDGECWFEGDV